MNLHDVILHSLNKLSDKALDQLKTLIDVELVIRERREMASPTMAEVELARAGRKIDAIKSIRVRYKGLGLRDAKELIEKYM